MLKILIFGVMNSNILGVVCGLIVRKSKISFLNRGLKIFWLIYEFKRIDISSIFRISKVCVLCYFRNLELTSRCSS